MKDSGRDGGREGERERLTGRGIRYARKITGRRKNLYITVNNNNNERLLHLLVFLLIFFLSELR